MSISFIDDLCTKVTLLIWPVKWGGAACISLPFYRLAFLAGFFYVVCVQMLW